MARVQTDRIGAAIDVGSNSVHLLVARERRRESARARAILTPLVDRSDLIGLGDIVDASGAIPPDALQLVVDSLHALSDAAAEARATRIVALGTEPLRRARNADELQAAAARYVGLELHVLSEREEAELTFVGVTGGHPPPTSLVVVDIGGGSTEAGIYLPGEPLRVVPLRVGSSRLSNSIVRSDPPTADELDALSRTVRETVASADWPDLPPHAVTRAVFVGGTATNVARLGRLSRRQLRDDLGTLARMPADEVIEHYGVRPRRARQLAAGVAIVDALLEHFGLRSADVSEASLRDGAIITGQRYGDAWRGGLADRLGYPRAAPLPRSGVVAGALRHVQRARD